MKFPKNPESSGPNTHFLLLNVLSHDRARPPKKGDAFLTVRAPPPFAERSAASPSEAKKGAAEPRLKNEGESRKAGALLLHGKKEEPFAISEHDPLP